LVLDSLVVVVVVDKKSIVVEVTVQFGLVHNIRIVVASADEGKLTGPLHQASAARTARTDTWSSHYYYSADPVVVVGVVAVVAADSHIHY
jgi:hypothetical protein